MQRKWRDGGEHKQGIVAFARDVPTAGRSNGVSPDLCAAAVRAPLPSFGSLVDHARMESGFAVSRPVPGSERGPDCKRRRAVATRQRNVQRNVRPPEGV
ncbi:MAG: hypothetical protein M0Z28_13400 [Rhodospirillales bacterium]|nr:hypothetical protein [Rhodospirillales bacterium]